MSNTIFIFLDDVRLSPDGPWSTVRSANAAYNMVLDAYYDDKKIVISLDHDLGEFVPTGYDLLNWLEKEIVTNDGFRPNISFLIHSANPVGRANMERAIKAIEKRLFDDTSKRSKS